MSNAVGNIFPCLADLAQVLRKGVPQATGSMPPGPQTNIWRSPQLQRSDFADSRVRLHGRDAQGSLEVVMKMRMEGVRKIEAFRKYFE